MTPEFARRIESLDDLAGVPQNTVLVDRIGCAWQVIELGEDWSHTKGHPDTRRPGFVLAGSLIHYELAQMITALPMRVVDRGEPEPPIAVPSDQPVPEKLILFAGEIPNGVGQ